MRIVTNWYAAKFWQIARQADCALNFMPKNQLLYKKPKKFRHIAHVSIGICAVTLSFWQILRFCALAKVWLLARSVLYIENIHLIIFYTFVISASLGFKILFFNIYLGVIWFSFFFSFSVFVWLSLGKKKKKKKWPILVEIVVGFASQM